MTNKLGSANPDRIPKPVRIGKDTKYLRLMRKLHRAERRIQDIIPMDIYDDVNWEDMGTTPSGKPYTKEFVDLLPTELQRIEYRRLRKARQDVYFEIFDYYDNDETKITNWFREYHDWAINDGSYNPLASILPDNIPFLKPKNDIGVVVWGGEDAIIPKDKMPVTYQVINDLPINDELTKDEAYIVRINSVELTINYDMYQFMEWIRVNKKNEKFHFATTLRDLEIAKVIRKDYRGKPNDMFQSRKEVLPHLFEKLKTPKGYWVCKVKHWIGTPIVI